MEYFALAIDVFIHLDRYLDDIIKQYGLFTYAIIFIIIFCETGLVITPFLPGDSLLFAIGSICAIGSLELPVALILIALAAILGDTVNYYIGAKVGTRAFSGNVKFLKKEYLDKTHQFYEKHGGKTIIFARFIPIIRTFAPFVAGVGTMTYSRFFSFNVIGGIAWTLLFVISGFLFGNIPFVRNNFSLVIIAIIFISILPGIIEYIRAKRKSNV